VRVRPVIVRKREVTAGTVYKRGVRPVTVRERALRVRARPIIVRKYTRKAKRVRKESGRTL
jgi:hypothetical protein